MQEVVVTASKRAEKLQDTPEAISVLGSKILDNLGTQSFSDYSSLVPNLGQSGTGVPGAGTIILRGLYSGTQSLTNTTSVYLGDTPFTPNGGFSVASASTPDPDLIDISRVEVLKGPQGTLYGASSLGGIIRFIPREPDVNQKGLSGNVSASGSTIEGGDFGYGFRGSVYDALLPGKLAIGVSGFDRRSPGWSTNVATGFKDGGQTDAQGGTVAIVAKPIDNLTIRGRVLLQDTSTKGIPGQFNYTGTNKPVYGERKTSTYFDETVKTNYQIYDLSGDYKTPYGNLSAVVSQTRTSIKEQIDYTGAYGALFTLYAPFYGAVPAGSHAFGYAAPHTSADNEELKFTSRRFADKIEFIVGGFHTDQTNLYLINLRGLAPDGTPLKSPYYNLATSGTPTSYRETAVYGDVTYYITPRLDVTGGLRQTWNEQGGLTRGVGLIYGAGKSVALPETGTKTLYQADVRWRPTDDLSLYARSADGYRPGGAQNNVNIANPTYGPDTLYDYEVGAKGTALDKRLTFDGSLYYMDWEKIQLNALVGGITTVGNAGAAHVKGFEFQSTYAVTQAINVGGSFGYNDARLSSVGATTAAALGAKAGDRLPASPRVTAAVWGDYFFPITADIRGDVGATVRYQGDKIASYSADPLNLPFREPAYTLLDLRASAVWQRYTFRAFLLNVADTNGYTGYTTSRIFTFQTTPSQALLTTPRTFMVTVSADF